MSFSSPGTRKRAPSLPYLIRIPLGPDGIVVKARETWPRTAEICTDSYRLHPMHPVQLKGKGADSPKARPASRPPEPSPQMGLQRVSAGGLVEGPQQVALNVAVEPLPG